MYYWTDPTWKIPLAITYDEQYVDYEGVNYGAIDENLILAANKADTERIEMVLMERDLSSSRSFELDYGYGASPAVVRFDVV